MTGSRSTIHSVTSILAYSSTLRTASVDTPGPRPASWSLLILPTDLLGLKPVSPIQMVGVPVSRTTLSGSGSYQGSELQKMTNQP